MSTKCILARKDELLLGSIVEDLLTHSEGMELTEIMGRSQAELIEAVENNHPEVLIMCHKSHDTMPADYLGILQKFPDLLIITVTTDDNYMHIYGKQKVLMTQSSDLLSIIRNH